MFVGEQGSTMAGAKRELEDAVAHLEEDEAELVLSLVHYLRSQEADEGEPPSASDPPSLSGWVQAMLLLDRLDDEEASDLLDRLRERLHEDGSTRAWMGLAEPALARAWDRPEEDEAWTDL